ncbi:MAG: DUF86 domain-containing protein [Muribaculaceae bacterium]|nr:DUF86 domain-containing protein [Muribaculaceae bacterium]
MRDTVKDKGRIEHMIEMAQILSEKGKTITLTSIQNDKILFYGLSKMIEIIGEAAYMLTSEFKEQHSELPWRQIIGMRHILVHGYFTISPDVLFDVIRNDIPAMIPILENYSEEFNF